MPVTLAALLRQPAVGRYVAGPGGGGGGAERAGCGLLRRLVEVGVVGFGVGVQQAEVPSALVTAADSVGLDAAGTVQHAARPAQSAERPGWPPSWTPEGFQTAGSYPFVGGQDPAARGRVAGASARSRQT